MCLETAVIISFCFWTIDRFRRKLCILNFWIDPFPAGENLRIILAPVGRPVESPVGLWIGAPDGSDLLHARAMLPVWQKYHEISTLRRLRHLRHPQFLNSECTSKKGLKMPEVSDSILGQGLESCSYPHIPPQIVLDMNPLERVSEFAISWIAVCFPLWDPLIAPWISMNGQ